MFQSFEITFHILQTIENESHWSSVCQVTSPVQLARQKVILRGEFTSETDTSTQKLNIVNIKVTLTNKVAL